MEDRQAGNIAGYIHSFQSLGAVDGPGLRYVVFMQGCPLRCAYCHNPDTWDFAKTAAITYTAAEVVEQIRRYKPYIKNGGVTVSGGEALMQPEFVEALFYLLKKEGVHTALDTSCIGDLKKAARVLKYTDLVLADLKFSEPQAYKKYCGADMARVLEFLKLTQEMGVALWIRHVVVPGLNDDPESIQTIGRISASFKNLEKLELLPFKKLCMSKYEQMRIDFPLKDYAACSEEKIKELEKVLNAGLT